MTLARSKKKKRKKRRRKPSRTRQRAEFAAVYLLYALTRVTPMIVLSGLSRLLGNVAFIVLGGRRRVAVDNIRHALGSNLGRWRTMNLARKSFQSFLLALPELVKQREQLLRDDARDYLVRSHPELEPVFQKVLQIHRENNGCIFVTPHLGNWEMLPFVATAFKIPTAITVRPLDNPYLERFVYKSRSSSGQLFIPNRNSLLTLERALADGSSVALLPDQSTKRGVAIPFFGRPAYTTPIPATLALMMQRPLVVVACCRIGRLRFTGYVSDPIQPRPGDDEWAEITRLTEVMNRRMEEIIRRHPEQYFWMHKRWKSYHHKSRREKRAQRDQECVG